MRKIFSDNVKFSTWQRLWVALAESEKELGQNITDEQIEEMKAHIGTVDYTVADNRLKSIEASFFKTFFKTEFKAFSSGDFIDDRANALAVLSGLAPESCYPDIRKVLLSVFNSTVYMENFVLTALCEMGYIEDAYRRMCARYYNLARNENSTLWEDFIFSVPRITRGVAHP